MSGQNSRKRILITGCSSGIGRAAALFLAKEGHHVIATARPGDDLDAFASKANITVDHFDLVEADQCRAAVEKHEQIDVLINNAGYGLLGPAEMLPDDRLKHQFDVNVFGAMRMAKLVLPQMRERGEGTIINIGSVAGKVTYALGGAYCATKHALEALSDAMRLELAPFGIRVVLIEPGTIDTKFYENANNYAVHTGVEESSPYHAFAPVMEEIINQPAGSPPEVVCKAIVKAIESGNPPARLPVTGMGKTFLFLRWLFPDRLMDGVLRRFQKLPKNLRP
ncbi:MAG: SDR family NAD(P)-dependent oxidoreductase [Verrucomicrobiota bacterium]